MGINSYLKGMGISISYKLNLTSTLGNLYKLVRTTSTMNFMLLIKKKYNWLTCSTMDANLPNANPCSSSLVITALPSFTTSRLAYFSWLLSVNVFSFFCVICKALLSKFGYGTERKKKLRYEKHYSFNFLSRVK